MMVRKENELIIHSIKIMPAYFDLVIRQEKPWEYRLNDRDYRTHDSVILNEWSEREGFTGRKVMADIGYIHDCVNGYIIFTLRNIRQIGLG